MARVVTTRDAGTRYLMSHYCFTCRLFRKNNQLVEAVDLICPHEEPIFAPFDGEISYHQPFGGEHEKSCADQGARIDGTGQWRGE